MWYEVHTCPCSVFLSKVHGVGLSFHLIGYRQIGGQESHCSSHGKVAAVGYRNCLKLVQSLDLAYPTFLSSSRVCDKNLALKIRKLKKYSAHLSFSCSEFLLQALKGVVSQEKGKWERECVSLNFFLFFFFTLCCASCFHLYLFCLFSWGLKLKTN